jgi:hypothetical protein
VFDGIFGGGGSAFGRGGAGATTVAFSLFGIQLLVGAGGFFEHFGVEHLRSALSVAEGVRGFEKIPGKLLKGWRDNFLGRVGCD